MSSEKTVLEVWEELAQPILTSDGTNQKFPFDTQDNKDLVNLIRELSSVYLDKCEHKFAMLHEKAGLEHMALKDSTCDIDEVQGKLDNVENRIKQFDSQLITINASALKKLLNSETFKGISTKGDDQGDTTSKLAIKFLTPIIQYAVTATCIHSGYVVDIRDDPRLIDVVKTIVPRSFGGKK
jgi:hypothetical protein